MPARAKHDEKVERTVPDEPPESDSPDGHDARPALRTTAHVQRLCVSVGHAMRELPDPLIGGVGEIYAQRGQAKIQNGYRASPIIQPVCLLRRRLTHRRCADPIEGIDPASQICLVIGNAII